MLSEKSSLFSDHTTNIWFDKATFGVYYGIGGKGRFALNKRLTLRSGNVKVIWTGAGPLFSGGLSPQQGQFIRFL